MMSKIIPPKKKFEIAITIKSKRHLVLGSIVYERNPKYDPDALKKWQDPCAGW